MAKNNSPSSKAYQKRRMIERAAAGRVALPVVVANWPEVFAAKLPFVDSIVDELHAASVQRGIALPRDVIQMVIIVYMRKKGYKKCLKESCTLIGLKGTVSISQEERDQRYAVYKAQFCNYSGRPKVAPRPAKPVF